MLLRLRSIPLRFLLPAAAAAALVVLLAAAMLVPREAADGDAGGSVARSTEPAPAAEPALDMPASDDAVAAAEASRADAAVGTEAVAPASPAPNLGIHIARTGAIELRVKRGSFERAWGDVQSVAGSLGGLVSDASRSGAGDGPRLGTITLQVPSRRFDDAIEQLRGTKGASVRRLDISSQDVTQEYVDTRSRLRHNRAVEERLLALLADTNGVGEVLAVQQRLDGVQEAIEIATGRLDQLKAMTTMSTIAVTVREPGAKAGADAPERGGSSIADGWADARERFAANVGSMVAWAGGAAPVLLLLVLLAGVARAAWAVRIRRIAAAREQTPAQT